MNGMRTAAGGLVVLALACGAWAAEPGTVKNLEYAKVGKKSLLLDLYLPARAGAPAPLVVWIHGGGWSGGSKDPCWVSSLTASGFAVASINYRLSQEAVFPAQVEDCKGAVRYLRAHAGRYGLDAAHVGVWGASAGGHLAALMGTSGAVAAVEGTVGGNAGVSSAVQCVVDYFGPTDFMRFGGGESRARADSPASPLVRLVGGPLETKKELVALANPITHVTKDDPPFLVVHGDQDRIVPLQQSQLLVAALQKAGVPVAFEVVKGGGHGFSPAQNQRVTPIVVAFLSKHLKPAAATRPASRPGEP